MSITVKRAGIEDMEALMKWRMRVLDEVFSESNPNGCIRINNENYYKTNLINGNHTACFAYDDQNEIIGCGGICYQTELPSPDNISGTNGYLMNIYTLPNRRGKGVGRKIVEFLISDARSRGVDKIYLESSRIAKKLYEEMGFTNMNDLMRL